MPADAPGTGPGHLDLRLAAAPGSLRAGPSGTSIELAPLDALLLAWLALEGATTRERLASLLWPGSGTEAARNALRQRLSRLRRQCPVDPVSGSSVLSLADHVVHDLHSGDGLLGSLSAPGCPEVDRWLAARRGAARARARERTEARIQALESAGDFGAALPPALELLDTDPLSEDAHRRVMRLHYLRGDRAAALLAFDRCAALLKDEVGALPSRPTLELLRTVQTSDDAGAVAGFMERPERPAASVALAPLAPHGTTPGRPHGTVPASVLRPPRLVGRDHELKALRHGVGAGNVVLVMGEAGMGKSRLLQALQATPGVATDAEPRPELVFASARPGDALVPYASVVRLLQRLLDAVPAAPSALDPTLRGRLTVLLPALGDAAGAAVPSGPPLHQSFTAPVQALLDAAELRGVAGLVLDDLHFGDDASLDLLQALLTAPRPIEAQRQPLHWCLGSRPPAPGTSLAALVQALESAAPVLRIPVPPLTQLQVAELVDSLGLPGVVGAALAPVLRQRSGGNPLFVLETLKLGWAEGRLGQGGGDGGMAGTDLPRPLSLQQLIGQQLARLTAPAMALARLAAVAGVDFALPLAERALGQDALQLADAWHELEAQHVLVGTDFAHDLLQEVVLNRLPAPIARHLHGVVAAALEAAQGEPARVAAHWEAADRRERALPSLRAAAERARLARRPAERIGFLLRAADIAEGSGERAQAFVCIAQAVETHMNSIRQADGFPLLDRLDRLADGDAEQARALGHRAWYCSQLPDHAQAAEIGARALAIAMPQGDRALIGPIRQRLATALSMLGRFDEALVHLRAVQAWADDHLAPDALAEFHGNVAVVFDNLGRPEQALVHHRRAGGASQALADHAQRTTHLGNHAVNRLNAGDATGALALVTQAQALVAGFELQGSSVAFLWLVRSQAARALGLYRSALEAVEAALGIAAAVNPARLPVILLQRAHVWLELGQHARAGQDLHAAADGLPQHLRARRFILLARLQHALKQNPESALQEADAAAPAGGWPEVQLTVDVERAACLPADAAAEAHALLQRVLDAAAPRGLCGSVLAARLGIAGLAGTGVMPAATALAARAALAQADSADSPVVPTLRPRAEVWLQAARGLAGGTGAGDREAAAATAARGRKWLLDTAADNVPDAFRDGFLHRAPVHRALLAFRLPGGD